MLKKETGFTLIEMLIVLAIITLLLILVVPNLAKQNEDIHTKGESAIVQMVDNQIQSYYLEHGDYPATINQLVSEGYLSTDTINNGSKKIILENTNPPIAKIIDADE